MATVKQKLQSQVVFGGRIDPSWSKSVTGMQRGVETLTKRSADLTKEQAKLAAKIKAGTLAGKNVSKLQQSYEKVGRQIRETTEEQNKLNRSLKRAEGLSRWRGRLAKAGKGTLRGGYGMGSSIVKWGSAGLIAGVASAAASPIMMMQQTAEQAGLARSYGVGIDTYKAWDGIGRLAGLNAENVGDLFEEYRNKVSDYKQDPTSGALYDSLPELGFKAGAFVGMNNQQQGEAIIERLLKMKDEQRAAGIADAIFGGEGNKLLTAIRATGKSFSDLEKEQRRYNSLTKAGADGAIAGNSALYNLWDALESGAAEVSGLLGAELAPEINNVAGKLGDWFKNGGIEKIKSIFTDDIVPGMKAFGSGLVLVSKVIYAVAKRLAWVIPDEADTKKGILSALARGDVNLARATAKGTGQEEWLENTLKDNPNLPAELKDRYIKQDGYFFADKEAKTEYDKRLSELSDDTEKTGLLDEIKTLLNPVPATDPRIMLKNVIAASSPGAGGGNMLKQDIRQEFNILQQPGEKPDALAGRIADTSRKSDPFNGNNVLADMPGGW